VSQDVVSEVLRLAKKRKNRKNCILANPEVKNYLTRLHQNFVLTPIDKAGNNIAIVCKKFYVEQTLKELKLFKPEEDEKIEDTYIPVGEDINVIIDRHTNYMMSNFNIDIRDKKLPFLYWIPKMHKKPFSKQRYIAASNRCSTKELSKMIAYCLKSILSQHRKKCLRYFRDFDINPMWVIDNSNAVHESITAVNRLTTSKDIRSYDFSTLYTAIPHHLLKSQIAWVINTAFTFSKKSFLTIYGNSAYFSSSRSDTHTNFNATQLINHVNWLIDNIYVKFGNKYFRQVIGIPMGTDCAPMLANLFLYSYEYKWIDKQRSLGRYDRLAYFKNMFRYIDDLLAINNRDKMEILKSEIYPLELTLNQEDNLDNKCSFLDLLLKVEDKTISTSIFDKRDDFGFSIVNLPNLTGNVPKKSSYGVFTGELVRYARACTYLDSFQRRVSAVVNKLTNQSFNLKLLKSTYKKFCISHFFLIRKYGSKVLSLLNHNFDSYVIKFN